MVSWIESWIRTVWEWAWEMAGRYMPARGIFKFRSIAEANAHRRAWEDQCIAFLRKDMEKVPSDHTK
jgi:hypothetical protein